MAFDFRKLPRCGAKARSRNGAPCLQPAMKNGRCYWHGGKSTGATAEGIKEIKKVNTKHGYYSKERINKRKKFTMELARAKNILENLLEDDVGY